MIVIARMKRRGEESGQSFLKKVLVRGSAALAVQRFWSRLVRQASILNTTQGRSHTVTQL